MRQKTPWGAPSTNPGAFGVGADDQTFGQSSRLPGVTPDQTRLGDAPDAAPAPDAQDAQELVTQGNANPALTTILTSVGLAAAGGGLVGWLATGGRGWKGAAIGASTNAALVYAGTALAGRNRISGGMLAAFVGLGLACAGGAGYLFMQQRKRR